MVFGRMKSALVDYFCTPRSLGAKMVRAVGSLEAECIADFSAGDGMLLRIAQNRWADCRIAATDIRDEAVYKLRRSHPEWKVGRCDFLSAASRGHSQLLSDLNHSESQKLR